MYTLFNFIALTVEMLKYTIYIALQIIYKESNAWGMFP